MTAVLAFGVASIGWAQAPPPLAGQRGQSAAPAAQTNAGAAQAAASANLPASPGREPLAAISAEVKSPGTMFPALFSMPKGDDFDHFGYEAHEYSSPARRTASHTRRGS